MIYEVEQGFVISSGGTWLPGAFATRQAANWAFQFSDETLYKLSWKINNKGRLITTDDLKEVRRELDGR